MQSEMEINARFNALIEQRNNALNSNVLLAGELAVANSKLTALAQELEACKASAEQPTHPGVPCNA